LNLESVSTSDGNDYFALQLDHSSPLEINVQGVSSTASITLLEQNGTVRHTAKADADGNVHMITSSLPFGQQYYLQLQTDAHSTGYQLIVDGNYHVEPATQPSLASGQDTGPYDNDSITNVTAPTLSGTAQPNIVVLVFDGTSNIGQTYADASGVWNFTTPYLSDGSHSFSTKAQDISGNPSEASQPLLVTIDTHAPSPSSLPVAQKLSITELSDKPLSILTGTAEAGATVALYDGNVLLGGTFVKSTGEWSFTLPELTDGIHTITSFVFDAAGNKSLATDLNITAVNVDAAELTTSADQILVGNGWFNVVSFNNSTAGITLNLTSQLSQATGFGNKTLVSIEGIIGSQFNDFIQGNDDVNIIDGNGGVDILAGGKGNDVYIVHSNS
jgi:hypothetical protein